VVVVGSSVVVVVVGGGGGGGGGGGVVDVVHLVVIQAFLNSFHFQHFVITFPFCVC
jgi:hypothetical protein